MSVKVYSMKKNNYKIITRITYILISLLAAGMTTKHIRKRKVVLNLLNSVKDKFVRRDLGIKIEFIMEHVLKFL